MENIDITSLQSAPSDLSPLDPLNDTCGSTYVACGSTYSKGANGVGGGQ
jgi:hypothetical protein